MPANCAPISLNDPVVTASISITRSDRVAICGGGLLGTSLALGLAAEGWSDIRIADLDPAVRDELRLIVTEQGHAGAVRVMSAWAEAAESADVIIAAVPPQAVAAILADGARVAAAGALLTDVAGVKAPVVREVAERLASQPQLARQFVGGHPMAGSERSGPRAGDPTLFSGATWILTPDSTTDDDAVARAGSIARALGARVLVLDAQTHDTIVGLVSHLPQLVASVLADVAAEAVGADRDAVMAVAGPGFRDTTRIAASDPALWLDILDGNRGAVVAALAAFSQRLGEVARAVEDRDDETLVRVLARASEARRRLVPKALDEPTAHLVVPLRDRPGEIARIAGALGGAGINIEDLAMRHATAADRGVLLLRVLAASVTRAIEALERVAVDGVVVEEDQQQDRLQDSSG